LVVDGSGAVYVATEGRCRVRRVAGGIITTVAGNGQCTFSGDGPATNASLFTPADLAFDDDGNAYIAEDWNCRVRKVTNGTILTVAGTFLPDYGSCATCCNAGQATNTPLYHPISVLADGSGDFYFGDYSCSVQKVESGILTTVVGSPYHCGWGGDGEAATEARIGLAYGLASDASGNLYVAGDCRVRKVSAGIITTVVGDGSCSYSPNDEGAPGEDAGIDPRGIAVDASGELYIADFANCRVRRVSGGTITTVAGDGNCTYGGDDGPGTSASLWNPSDVALDSNGALYIADRYNYRIRKLVGGTITTVAGNGNFGYSEDGLPATSATLNYLSGIAVDDDDNLYFTDGTRVRIVYSAVYQQIADMYAPLLLLSGGDYEPEEVGIMTADSTGVAQATLRNSSGAALLDQDTLLGDLCTHSDSDNYLDIDGLAPQSDVKMYAHTYSMIRDAFTDTAYARVVKDANDNGKVAAIQYWFFYFFDDWNNKHEGDWEQITLSFEPSASATDILSGSIEPKRAGYSQHTGGKKREWQDVETDPGVHPLVYVAAGSHANYFRAGTFRWGQWEDNATGNRLIAPAISLVPPTPPSSCGATADWLRYAGLWGQDVSLFRWPAGDGPNSPPTGRGHEAAWNNPTSWLNGLRSDTGYFGWPDCILPVDTFCRRSPSPPQQVTIGQNLQKIFTVIEAARSKFHIH